MPEAIEGRLGFPPLPHGRRDRPGRQLRHLLEEADPGAPAPPDLAFLGQLDSGDDPQQGGFPGAVDPHDPYPVPVRDGEREALEQHPVDPTDGDLLEIDEEGHGASRVPAPG